MFPTDIILMENDYTVPSEENICIILKVPMKTIQLKKVLGIYFSFSLTKLNIQFLEWPPLLQVHSLISKTTYSMTSNGVVIADPVITYCMKPISRNIQPT